MQPKLVRPRPSLVVPPHVAAARARPKPAEAAPSTADDDYVQTGVGLYTKAKWNGCNESGIEAFADRILVMTDMPATTSKGGIEFTEEHKDKTGLAAETGVLIELAEGAFTWSSDRTRPFAGTKPDPGQRIYFERYAGNLYTGRDGKNYRLMDDRCLAGFEKAD